MGRNGSPNQKHVLKIGVIPFRAKHLAEIEPGVTEAMIMLGQLAECSGSAYTAVLCGDPIGAAGIAVVKPGVGEAWSLLSPMIKRFPVALHKAVKTRIPEIMARHGLRRVHMTVDPWDVAAIRWAECLGFEREGLMRRFGDNGADMFLFARVR